MREIVFDTETTGLTTDEHRIVEIGAVELMSRLPTGRTFHIYLNPERDIDASAVKIHGITNEKVANEPFFKDIAEDFLDFIAQDPLVAHNASFDMSFLNMELERLDRTPLTNPVVDTLMMARKQLPGARHSLDALCRRYNVDLSARTYHGALLDAQLLADVYVELTGGLQGNLILDAQNAEEKSAHTQKEKHVETRTFKTVQASEEEVALHQRFLETFTNPLWHKT